MVAATKRAALEDSDDALEPPLPYAGLGLRIVAFLLDCLVMASFLAIFFSIAGAQILLRGGADAPDAALWFFYIFPPVFFVPFAILLHIFLWHWRGQSIGMMAVRIAVTNLDGDHLSYRQAFARALLWPLSILPLGIGLLPVLFSRQRRTLHDRLSGTVVLELP